MNFDPCCAPNRKRENVSDFLMEKIFRKNIRIKGDKIGEFKLDNNRWFRLYKGTDGKLYYECSDSLSSIVTLEALCEEYEESEGKMTKESAIQRLNEIRGFKVNQLVLNVVEKVTKCLTR